MYKFRVNKLTLNSTSGAKDIDLKSLNIIIGPNNSGKSKLLKEVSSVLAGEDENIDIIEDLKFSFPENKETFIKSYDIRNKISIDLNNNHVLRVYSNKNVQSVDSNMSFESRFSRDVTYIDSFWEENLDSILENKNNTDFFRIFGQLFYQYLGTEEKLLMSNKQKNYGLDSQQLNFLSSIKFNKRVLKELSDYTKEMFNKDLYLDTETLGESVVFRVGEDFEFIRKSAREEVEIVNKLINYKMLDGQGDGIKSFVSTYLSMANQEKDVVLIDEPENSLHPPLARKIGEMIGNLSNKNKQIFISTHSADIIKGILSMTSDVNIIRITQPIDGQNNITLVNKNDIEEIITDPMLRVTRVIEGLFAEKVVITESESDELVYQELISTVGKGRSLYFTHGHGKQTLYKIAELYKNIGVDYALVFDFDLIRKKDDVKKILKLIGINETNKDKITTFLYNIRESIHNSIDSEGLNEEEKEKERKKIREEVYKKQGLNYFEGENLEGLTMLIEFFTENKVHILQTGELETTLEPLGIEYSKNKSKWIINAINKINILEEEDIRKIETIYKFLNQISKLD